MEPSLLSPAVNHTKAHTPVLNGAEALRPPVLVEKPTVLDLVYRLCRALAEADVQYCHWKSNNALDRSASGDNDLDLLVSRRDAARFTEILFRLGFKQGKAPADKQMNGVLDYFGYDEPADKWVHVHAHYQLIMGHDMTKNFRLPLEEPYLASAQQGDLFKVPAVEFEFVVFVIRMVLKHATWDAILGREGQLNKRERKEFAYFQTQVNQARVQEILQRHLPYIPLALFNRCVQALQPGCAFWPRVKTSHRLQTLLQANARHGLLLEPFLKLCRRVIEMLRWRIFKSPGKYHLALGGAAVALAGGDGAGKSTAIDALAAWLSEYLEVTKVHLGKPAWSWTTITIRSVLKLGQLFGLYGLETSFDKTLTQQSLVSPGYPFLLREVCLARDRYNTYVQARRWAADGNIVIFDRIPLAQIQLMDGPQGERFINQLASSGQANGLFIPRKTSWLANSLLKLEQSYYQRIALPELLIVLRLDPELAVARKPEDDAETVRARSREIWSVDWKKTKAHVIDASKPKAAVLAEIKALFWSEL